ncbi:hypothetical protein DM02DRAFT_615546 [Periconia macrospinosa]|uniref:Uncharacterized protein n=1 Tax=Periconia macrospinosa TaxID=97972 RepID=A0A2V1DLI9_9PLEO|nr:hypothetical protein DM02DRAFT_615546 [Periconia macrospinosa]
MCFEGLFPHYIPLPPPPLLTLLLLLLLILSTPHTTFFRYAKIITYLGRLHTYFTSHISCMYMHVYMYMYM